MTESSQFTVQNCCNLTCLKHYAHFVLSIYIPFFRHVVVCLSRLAVIASFACVLEPHLRTTEEFQNTSNALSQRQSRKSDPPLTSNIVCVLVCPSTSAQLLTESS